MSLALPQFFFSLGAGGIGGFLIGYATKKILKIAMVCLGLYLISLLYLMQVEVIKIDLDNLFVVANNFLGQTLTFFSNILSYLPIAGSFSLGLILGFTKG